MRASRDYTAEPTFKLTQFASYDAINFGVGARQNAGGVGWRFATFDEKRAITGKRYKIDAQFLLMSNRKSYAFYQIQMAMFPMTFGDP